MNIPVNSAALLDEVNASYTELTQKLAEMMSPERYSVEPVDAKRAVIGAMEAYTTPAAQLMAHYRELIKNRDEAHAKVVGVLNRIAAADNDAVRELLDNRTTLADGAQPAMIEDEDVILASDDTLSALGLVNSVLGVAGVSAVVMVSESRGGLPHVSFR